MKSKDFIQLHRYAKFVIPDKQRVNRYLEEYALSSSQAYRITERSHSGKGADGAMRTKLWSYDPSKLLITFEISTYS
jgi:hypothetical protein